MNTGIFGLQLNINNIKIPLSGTNFITNGLLGWYRFLEGSGTSTADSSGNQSNATLLNGATWVTGVPSDPVSPYGIFCNNPNGGGYTNNQSVDTNSSWADNLLNFSVCCWFKIPTSYTAGDNATMMGKITNGASNTGNGWILNCELNGPTTAGLVFFLQQSNGATWIGNASNVAVNDNAWHHACATISGSTTNSPIINLYLDASTAHVGAPSSYKNGTWSGATGFSNTTHVILGNAVTNSPVNSNEPLDGTMADCRVYNRVLSSTEVTQIFNLTG